MGTPTYNVASNQSNNVHQAAPGWCVAFVRFKNPVCGYSTNQSLLETKPLLIVENDCTSVLINNPKNSFAKTMTVTVKVGDIYYYNAVAPGDWVCAWMSDDQDAIANIVNILDSSSLGFQKQPSTAAANGDNTSQLNNFTSGFKFLGRVVSVNDNDYMAGTKRIVNQTIVCQAFLELASSVYFTYPATVGRFTNENSTTSADYDAAEASYTNLLVGQTALLIGKKRFANFSEQFFQFMVNASNDPTQQLSPDKVIQFLAVLLLGMKSGQLGVDSRLGPFSGNFNDAISVPSIISQITGLPNAIYLWQFYNIVLGLQQFTKAATAQSTAGNKPTAKNLNNNPSKPWLLFQPDLDPATTEANNVVFTGIPCKGWVLFKPPVWSNESYWNIFSQYLNPTLNEMYTCLKVDGYNRIRPHFIVREQPYSTGLFQTFKFLTQAQVTATQQSESPQNPINASTQPPPSTTNGGKAPPQYMTPNPLTLNEPRTMYCSLPRWKIDENMIYTVNVSTNEAARINFVQVWGTNLGNAFAVNPNSKINSPENYKETQFEQGNYVADNMDIQRNGLRAEITESSFDLPMTNGVQSHAPVWARMRADWKFNGHLKPSGTVTLYGVNEPICEGDNVEVRGVVYHIENVQHTGMLQGNNKVFRTILTVSNGILASSLTSASAIPTYPVQLAAQGQYNPGPGITDAEFTGRPDRKADGTRVSTPNKSGNGNTQQ